MGIGLSFPIWQPNPGASVSLLALLSHNLGGLSLHDSINTWNVLVSHSKVWMDKMVLQEKERKASVENTIVHVRLFGLMNQPFTTLSCTSLSNSSLMNWAFEESKSKSVSNLRVASWTFATISWPLLWLLRLRGPNIGEKKNCIWDNLIVSYL